MNAFMLTLLDIFYTLLHSCIVLYIVFGWIFSRYRKAHLIFICVVLFAWIGIGAYVGTIGYCPITDWHWDVKRALGETHLPSSFIKYIVDRILHVDSDRTFIDGITVGGLVFGTAMSVYLLFGRR